MHFEDLTKYSYNSGRIIEQVVNIGWLEEHSLFRIGALDPRVYQLLEEHYAALVANQMRGHHGCPLCPADAPDPPIQVEGKRVLLGAAELWVPRGDGGVFVAPDLAIHYLRSHSYHPPEEFVAAVLRLPTTIVGWSGETTARMLCGDDL